MAEVVENQVVDGRYRILSRIGSGGMADVWCAQDQHLGRRVALKVLHHRFAQDREFVERFRREAESAAGLAHPNVVGVFDRGEFDGTYYIAMEYLDGRSLKELIDAGLEPREAIAIVRQILEASRFAHRRGIIHRDLKPQNVIVDSEGHATVTDFGIARAGVSEITQTGSVMGTAHYLSPEQAQGHETTAASDLYSIGVILYEALTGQVPFEGESAVAIALKQVSQLPRRPGAINHEVSPALDAVVMRALAKEPERRFRDADAFIAALDAAEREPSAAGGRDTAAFAPLPPVEGPARGAPAPAPAGALGPPTFTPREENDRRRRRRRLILVGIAVALGALMGWAIARDTTADVPDVIRFPLTAATDRLDSEGYDVETRFVRSQQPRNTVLEQDPIPGEADLDCTFVSFFCSKPAVTLTVSAGPGRAEVPGVSGLTREEAQRLLEKADFDVDVEHARSATVSEGFVISTDPNGGELATRGSTVVMTVSTGPRQVRVPVVIGLGSEGAVAQLEGAGLEASVSEVTSDQPDDQVLSQSPQGGSLVDPGSTVSLVVSSGAREVAVPNVIGKLEQGAQAALEARGLEVNVSEQSTDVEAQDGRVIDQFPIPGDRVEQGSTVTIFVGSFTPPPPPPAPPPTPAPTPTPTPPPPPRERAAP